MWAVNNQLHPFFGTILSMIIFSTDLYFIVINIGINPWEEVMNHPAVAIPIAIFILWILAAIAYAVAMILAAIVGTVAAILLTILFIIAMAGLFIFIKRVLASELTDHDYLAGAVAIPTVAIAIFILEITNYKILFSIGVGSSAVLFCLLNMREIDFLLKGFLSFLGRRVGMTGLNVYTENELHLMIELEKLKMENQQLKRLPSPDSISTGASYKKPIFDVPPQSATP